MQSLILIDGPVVDICHFCYNGGGGGQVFQGTTQVVCVMPQAADLQGDQFSSDVLAGQVR